MDKSFTTLKIAIFQVNAEIVWLIFASRLNRYRKRARALGVVQQETEQLERSAA
jgi:hypothetical protein